MNSEVNIFLFYFSSALVVSGISYTFFRFIKSPEKCRFSILCLQWYSQYYLLIQIQNRFSWQSLLQKDSFSISNTTVPPPERNWLNYYLEVHVLLSISGDNEIQRLRDVRRSSTERPNLQNMGIKMKKI